MVFEEDVINAGNKSTDLTGIILVSNFEILYVTFSTILKSNFCGDETPVPPIAPDNAPKHAEAPASHIIFLMKC